MSGVSCAVPERTIVQLPASEGLSVGERPYARTDCGNASFPNAVLVTAHTLGTQPILFGKMPSWQAHSTAKERERERKIERERESNDDNATTAATDDDKHQLTRSSRKSARESHISYWLQ